MEDRESSNGFNKVLSINSLRNLEEVEGIVVVKNKDITLSLSNNYCTYRLKN